MTAAHSTAKGIEAQTLMLFEVARARRIPVLTFLNKYDRPGRDPLELLDEIEQSIGLRPTPATWPVGILGDFRGVIDRRDGTYWRDTRTARGSTAAARPRCRGGCTLLGAVGQMQFEVFTHRLANEFGATVEPPAVSRPQPPRQPLSRCSSRLPSPN